MTRDYELWLCLHAANAYIKSRDYDKAENILRLYIDAWGYAVPVVIKLAEVLQQLLCYDFALLVLGDAVRANPESGRIYARIGDIHRVLHRYDRAIQAYEMALSRKNNDLREFDFVRDNLAMVYYAQGMYEKAEQLETEVLCSQPEHPRLQRNFAAILAAQKRRHQYLQLPQFTEEINKALNLAYVNALLSVNLDSKVGSRGETAFYQALYIARRLFHEDPENVLSVVAYAGVLSRIMRHHDAIHVLCKAITEINETPSRNSAPLYLELGRIYELCGMYDKARSVYETGRELWPEQQEEFCYRRFLLERNQDNWKDARKYAILAKDKLTFFDRHIYIIAQCTEHEDASFFTEINAPEACVNYYFSRLSIYKDEEYQRESRFLPAAIKGNAFSIIDCQSEEVNIIDGKRRIEPLPEQDYENTVYLYGRCMSYIGSRDSETLQSRVQQQLIKGKHRYKVVGLGAPGGSSGIPDSFDWYAGKFQPGDIVLFYLPHFYFFSSRYNTQIYSILIAVCTMLAEKGVRCFYCRWPDLASFDDYSEHEKNIVDYISYYCLPLSVIKRQLQAVARLFQAYGIPFTDVDEALEHPCASEGIQETWTTDSIHYRQKYVNGRIAEKLCAFITQDDVLKPSKTEKMPAALVLSRWKYTKSLSNAVLKQYGSNESIQKWIQQTASYSFSEYSSVGAVVMNCNPFTLGHYHLVKTALETVDKLYVFIVEEDKSQFSFGDRIELVKKGLQGFSGKVRVVPSGDFIISSITFAEYFTKESQNIIPDTSLDCYLFGTLIAPAFNIKYRFIGEEPNCTVTNAYNEQMLTLLPDMGIEVMVIPRKQIGGRIVSASNVRSALGIKDWNRIKEMVPSTTYTYLYEQFHSQHL